MTLYPHQVRAVEFVMERMRARKGSLLCYEMGLGKTLIGVSVAKEIRFQVRLRALEVAVVRRLPHPLQRVDHAPLLQVRRARVRAALRHARVAALQVRAANARAGSSSPLGDIGTSSSWRA